MTEGNDTQAGGGETLTLTQAELDAKIAEASEAAVEALKAKNAELLGETKAERAKRQALEQAQAEADRKRAEEKGEYQKLYQAEQEKSAKAEAALAEYRQQVTRSQMQAEAAKFANGLTRDTTRAEDLAEHFLRHAKMTDDGVKLELGGVEITREKFADHMKAIRPYLVDGSQASGGGATGGNGGAVSKKWSEMTGAEKVKLHREDPKEYERRKAAG